MVLPSSQRFCSSLSHPQGGGGTNSPKEIHWTLSLSWITLFFLCEVNFYAAFQKACLFAVELAFAGIFGACLRLLQEEVEDGSRSMNLLFKETLKTLEQQREM